MSLKCLPSLLDFIIDELLFLQRLSELVFSFSDTENILILIIQL